MLSRNNSMSQRTPRKSSSFLSLRREKEKSSASSANAPSAYNGPTSLAASCSPYFDMYPRPQHQTRSLKSRHNPRSTAIAISSSTDPSHDPVTTPNDKGVSYAFPSIESPEDLLSLSVRVPSGNGRYTRTRSRTGPSKKSKWEPSPVPQLRFSNSSSTQNTETPPHTPEDYTASSDSLDFPVLVAAPVSGVETMDALVDGMNGGDIVTVPSSTRSSSRHRFGGIPGHHPLYQPPLPIPPPGITLGGGKTRKVSKKDNLSADSSEDDNYPTVPTSTSRTRRRRGNPTTVRTASSSTITAPPSPKPDEPFSNFGHVRTGSKDSRRLHNRTVYNEAPSAFQNFEQRTSREIQRPHSSTSVENRKVIVPSISEIIRNHAPSAHAAITSRPLNKCSSSLYTPSSHGHATGQEDLESDPEPLARAEPGAEESDLVSRSSIDSVADEVQRTIRYQNNNRPQPRSLPPPTPTTAFKNRHSTLSDNASSIYSPRSDPGGTPSVYSFSATSSYFPSSPLDTTFMTMSKPLASQAVAQYLRSARLTTLLKLTRSPHASADNPLTVSLSDLGCVNGFPVVVFLGLGCVRHIMGLYDDMAQCMNLRLITIDRYLFIFHSFSRLVDSNVFLSHVVGVWDELNLGRNLPRVLSNGQQRWRKYWTSCTLKNVVSWPTQQVHRMPYRLQIEWLVVSEVISVSLLLGLGAVKIVYFFSLLMADFFY